MPHTCAELGVGCGSAQDGCGGTLMCGPCPDGKECQNGTCAGTCGAIGDACTSDGTCCGGICGAQGTSANLCCTPDHQPVVAVGYCCNGNNAAYNQNGTVYCGTPNCTANADCDDHDPCTHDTCDHGSCAHTAIAGCCISEATCDDGNDCTVDTCVSNACIHTPKNDNDPCGSDNRRSCCQGQCCGTGRHCRNGTCAASGGCFVAGTRIAMVDGTSRPIEMVAPGDLVLGRGGQVNRVVALARPMLGGRPLYAFDGGLGFVTGGHPFLTDAGWKAVDPAAAQQEIPNLRVGRLSAGDRVLRLVGATVPVGAGRGASGDGVSIRITAVELGQIAAVIANPATPLFNLTVDGDHTYFADDWLAHNKFYSAEPTSEHTPPAKHHSPKSGKQKHT
ncbi:MAG: hypothetical protein IT337_16125 [Thermomicrobiales bacterium]|nr:hypothetical protein [Thermomicrobiales bacterium]